MTRPCSNCGKEYDPSPKKRSSRCGPCRYHWATYGEERPADLGQQEQGFRKCVNCGVSLEEGHKGYNRCNACHMYKYRTGQERPRHLYTRFAAWAHAHPGETP